MSGRGVCAAVLTFEFIVIALAVPVAVAVSDVEARVAVPIGLALALACLLAAALLRSPAGYVLGSALQVLAIATGFVVPVMFVLGGLFAFLWFLARYLARQLERERGTAAG